MGKEPSIRSKPAFTLIELLVVIGIITLLIGVLLPALIKARTQAKDLACTSNIRQIVQALQIYAAENNGLLPAAMDKQGLGWQVKLWPMLYYYPLKYQADPTHAFIRNTVFECPQAAFSKNLQGPDGGYSELDHFINGYALNADLPGTSGNTGMLAVPGSAAAVARVYENKKPFTCRCPSVTMLLTDAQNYYVEYFNRGYATNGMDAGFGAEGGMLGALGRHARTRDCWNIAFLDGSVRLMHFYEVPGAPGPSFSPDEYYNASGGLLSPNGLLTTPGIPDDTKLFWVGLH